MSDFEHVFEKPPEGAAADWTIPQNWDAYTEVEHRTFAGRHLKGQRLRMNLPSAPGFRMRGK